MTRTPLTRRWTPKEAELLKEMLASGATPLTAAVKLRRRCSSVKRKIYEINRIGKKETSAGRSAPSPRKSDGIVRNVLAAR
jgi:hypothetical protein